MTKHLARHGVSVNSSNLTCYPCNKERAGGFSPELQEVLLCQDGFLNRKHMEDTIVHELLHLYDHAKFKVDWSNLRHVACSEVNLLGVVLHISNSPTPT
jgi:inner membrane protease ATP23